MILRREGEKSVLFRKERKFLKREGEGGRKGGSSKRGRRGDKIKERRQAGNARKTK